MAHEREGGSSGGSARELVVVDDRAARAQEAAERFARIAEAAVARDGRFTVALAGGSTPTTLYTRLATEPHRSRLPWRQTRIFWGDERCGPPDHIDSNFRMTNEALLRHLSTRPEGIYRMRGEDPDPDRAAADYGELLKLAFGLEGETLPRFDLILLGMGADGHTAWLLLGSPSLTEVARLVAAPYVERLRAHRLTLTLPVLNEALAVLFLVSGRDKAEMLHVVLDASEPHDRPPTQQVCLRDGRLTWLVD